MRWGFDFKRRGIPIELSKKAYRDIDMIIQFSGKTNLISRK